MSRRSFDDKGSLQRGFQTYMNYCSSCHELGFARYARAAEDLEIPEADGRRES